MDNVKTTQKLQDNVAPMYFEQCFRFFYFRNLDTMDISVKIKIQDKMTSKYFQYIQIIYYYKKFESIMDKIVETKIQDKQVNVVSTSFE